MNSTSKDAKLYFECGKNNVELRDSVDVDWLSKFEDLGDYDESYLEITPEAKERIRKIDAELDKWKTYNYAKVDYDREKRTNKITKQNR